MKRHSSLNKVKKPMGAQITNPSADTIICPLDFTHVILIPMMKDVDQVKKTKRKQMEKVVLSTATTKTKSSLTAASVVSTLFSGSLSPDDELVAAATTIQRHVRQRSELRKNVEMAEEGKSGAAVLESRPGLSTATTTTSGSTSI